jgi:hypothetical protein
MAKKPDNSAGWTAEQAWDALGRIRVVIEASVPPRLIGGGDGPEPTLDRELLALIQAIRLMGAHMPDQLDEAVLAEARAWGADSNESGTAVVDDSGDPSPETRGLP